MAKKVYKCVDANGTTVFSQDPCGGNAKEIEAAPSDQPAETSSAAVEIGLQAGCSNNVSSIANDYNGRLRDMERQIDALRESKRLSMKKLAGATRDTALEQQIAALQARKTTLQTERDAHIDKAYDQCREDAEREHKHMADEHERQVERAAEATKAKGDAEKKT